MTLAHDKLKSWHRARSCVEKKREGFVSAVLVLDEPRSRRWNFTDTSS